VNTFRDQDRNSENGSSLTGLLMSLKHECLVIWLEGSDSDHWGRGVRGIARHRGFAPAVGVGLSFVASTLAR
jgi:hypothetical protein